jgi:hypothetical protein
MPTQEDDKEEAEPLSYGTDEHAPIIHEVEDEDNIEDELELDVAQTPQTPQTPSWNPHIAALCQPPGTGQPDTSFPAMQCRGLKWEVLTNAEHPGIVGAVCVVKERNIQDEQDFRSFLMFPKQNIWLVVRKASINENNFADWKLHNMIIPGIKSLMGNSIGVGIDVGSDVEGNDIKQKFVLTQDGCGLDLNAMVRYIDGDDAMENLEVVKLFAKGTAIFQAHDVGKSHPQFKDCMANDYRVIVTTDASLLPQTHFHLWTFLGACQMDLATKRTMYKHMINCSHWLAKAFSRDQMRSAYSKCGLFPVNFCSFMQRMPAWKTVSEADILHVEGKIPDLVLLGMKQGAVLCSDVLEAVGPEWLMIWETKHLSAQAREELVRERLSYTPDQTSPLNRQGTVILTNANAKQLRKVAAETKSRKQAEKENNEELERERKAKEKVSVREHAIGVRHVYTAVATAADLKALTTPDLKALVMTYWEQHVHKFHVHLPSTWNGKTIDKFSSINKESLMEYALIILTHQNELPDVETTNDQIDAHIERLSSRLTKREKHIQQSEYATVRKDIKRKAKEDAEARCIAQDDLETVVHVSNFGRHSNVKRVKM